MSHKRKEIDEVTQKVQTTKKEIDHLKAELEKLINSGINSTKRFPSSTVDKENLAHNFHEPVYKPETRITFRNVSDVDTQPNLRNTHVSTHISRRDFTRLQPTSADGATSRNPSKSPDCNRIRSYSRDEARDYIKKQREKRKELAKLSDKTNVKDIETRKQKLKELHQKSLELVKKNLERKRKRSKSRETVKPIESAAQEKPRNAKNGAPTVSHIPDLIMTNVVDNKINPIIAQTTNKNRECSEKSSRQTDKICTKYIEKSCSSIRVPINDRMQFVTTTRGVERKNSFERQNRAATKIQSFFRGYIQRKRYKQLKVAKKQIVARKTTTETQTEIKNTAETVPDWLNPSALSHPYNFISTVKRKLNFAIKSSSPEAKLRTPERSFNISASAKTPSQLLFQKTKDELKEVIQKSAKSSRNNGNLWDMISKIRAADKRQSPDLIASGVQSDPQDNVHSNSDSDTSKNIPNISSASSTHSTRNKNTHTIGDTKKETSLDTDYPTQSDFSEPELNTDWLKHLQVQRKKHQTHRNEKRSQKDKNSYSSRSTIKTIKSSSEPNMVSSNKYKTEFEKSSKNSAKSVEDFPGKSTVTPDDIIAFNVSPLRSINNDNKPVENLTETLRSPSNLNLQLAKRDVALKSKSADSSIKTDTRSAPSYSYSSAFSAVSSKNLLSVPVLQHPDVTIYPTEKTGLDEPVKTTSVISLKENGEKATIHTKGNCNEIHLKIEAELHLLNDVNESLKKFMDIEKSVLELRDKHIQNSALKEQETSELAIVPENEIKSVNYSRGSDVSDIMNFFSLNSSDFEFDKGALSTGLDLSNSLSETKDSIVAEPSIAIEESLLKEPVVGVSLGTFEQLIKDEDRRIENLKLILKFREKTLLDRTKSELALLEIQRKHLKETGQLHEASILKKKQRGILMRMQHEHHEMQRLKQMQKTASKERKADLKQKRNMIKTQLSTNKMLTKTKLNTPRENQRNSGPFKVYNIQSHSESVRSETSISRNSITEEVVSVTSRSRSVVSRVSDVELSPIKNEDVRSGSELAKVDHIKKVLLTREAALQKRRKAAEEVLQWHKRLSEEEKKVAELEMVAKSIINEVAKETTEENVLLQKMTKREGTLLKDHGLTQQRNVHKCKSDKFSEKDSSYDSINTDVDYSSDVSSAIKTDVLVPNKSEQSKDSSNKQTLNNYTSDFETPTSLNNKEVFAEKIKHNDKIASITELIDNLTKINEENSILSKRSSLNKSIDAEIDKLASICTDTQTNASLVKTPPKNFKVETNKLLNLKEHLHQDNSKAILDSIESLKSSIKEITSKADRSRSSRRSSSETQSTEKDISEISSSSQSVDSVLNLSIPEEKEPEQGNSIEFLSSKSEQSIGVSDESGKVTTDVSFEHTPRIIDAIKSDSVIDEQKESIENISESESNASEIENLSRSETCSVKTLSQVRSSVLEETNQTEQESSHEECSEVTTEENKTLCDTQLVVESEKDTANLNLAASTLFIENNKLAKSANLISDEKIDLQFTKLENDNEKVLECKENEDENEKVDESDSTEKTDEDIVTESVNDKDKLLQSDSETGISENEVKRIEDVACVPDENVGKQLESLLLPQFEDISDISENQISANANDTLNELNNKSLLSFDNKVEEDKVIEIIEDKSLQEDEGISEEASPLVESLAEIASEVSYESKDEKDHVQMDVKKRVLEILADANVSFNKSEKNSRVQDLYVTTYDLISTENSPESYSPVDNNSVNILLSSKISSEAEELLKKQLAIEQEIKQIEQQQKEHIPYILMREIPNKPPPPYTPPVAVQVPTLPSVLPSMVDQIDTAVNFSADVLYSAYLDDNLEGVSFDEQIVDANIFKIVEKGCLKFLFDICKDLAVEHYEKFRVDEGPSWMKLVNKQKLSLNAPFNKEELNRYLNKKLKVLLGYEKVERRENAIIRWSRKKRDHVDEILVLESQAEESEWTSYDKDELYVKNDVTNEIMNMLLSETAEVLSKVLMKKNCCEQTVDLS